MDQPASGLPLAKGNPKPERMIIGNLTPTILQEALQ
jgi:hypothetical protein